MQNEQPKPPSESDGGREREGPGEQKSSQLSVVKQGNVDAYAAAGTLKLA